MYNNEFKQIDTEEKAYLLGQLFGDGCNQYTNRYTVKLISNKEDASFYKRLNTIFPFFHYHDNYKNKNTVVLSCGFKKLCLDLKNLGLTQNKCKQDKQHNFNLPNLEEPFMQHFIRGFFDADGSVYYPTRHRSRNNTRVEIGLGAENFCIQLYNYLNTLGIKSTYYSREKTAGNGKYYKTYNILISSRNESLKFASYIYKDASVYLERKKVLFDRYEKSDLQKRKELLPHCPKCGKLLTVLGYRGNKLRIRCRPCSYNVSIPTPLVNVN